MSNSRPSLASKHTSKTRAKQDASLDVGLTVAVDGTAYTVRTGDLTSMDTMALRRETGYSFLGLMRAVQTDADIDLIAALVWLSRRSQGERTLSYEAVASEIGYDVEIEVTESEADENAGEA